jgi:adenosylcobinamide kinase / adenosylcobinamide-phosphate guanylyltransferase
VGPIRLDCADILCGGVTARKMCALANESAAADSPAMSPSNPLVTLVTGGARAGKSAYALSLVPREGPVTFIATAQELDDEMRERIRRHRAERPRGWTTIEAPIELAAAIAAAPSEAIVLVDCLTLWMSNLLLTEGRDGTDGSWSPDARIDELLEALAARSQPVVVVTNEVGLGVVPATALGRVYRDALGRVNQRVASIAGRVVLMVAGLSVELKR